MRVELTLVSQRISVRKGVGWPAPVKTDKAEGFVKIQSTGNASLALSCLRESIKQILNLN